MTEQPNPNDQLAVAKLTTKDAARPDIVTKISASGKMTARQRIAELLDPGSEVEFGSIAAASSDGDWIPEAGGVDFIGTVDGQPTIASSTDYTDHGGGYGAGRLGRLFAVAFERRWPVVLFVDGGGSRAQHPRSGLGHIETSGQIGRFSFLDGLPELSGWVPTVAIVSGPAFAGHASLAGFSDFLISTPGSSIGMGGPPMVEAALGQRLTPNELAGSEMHELSGGIDLLVDSEQSAIDAAREYLGFYGNRDTPSADPVKLDLNNLGCDYDVRLVIDSIIDRDSFFELRPNFAPNLITALTRINGAPVGLMANRTSVLDGSIDEKAAIKIGRFVEQCNTYEYPLLSLIDTPGCTTQPRKKKKTDTLASASSDLPGLTRWHTRVLLAHQQRTVPLTSVQLGQNGGLAGTLMTGVSSTRGVPLMKLAWPSVTIGQRDGFSAVVDHNAFDDVIEPNETPNRVRRLQSLLKGSGDTRPPREQKKHWIDTW
ncbi:MAG: hypothetical protein GKR90_13535 [Pseudomonadales bacterium]|nr:hypothetical protein [Pseudomonadales bacterium]